MTPKRASSIWAKRSNSTDINKEEIRELMAA